jgi:hypothetical protein
VLCYARLCMLSRDEVDLDFVCLDSVQSLANTACHVLTHMEGLSLSLGAWRSHDSSA